MHRIGHIAIKNFRLCRDVSLPLEGFTPLVGQNNTGKSSILAAIAWVLKPSALAATDFSNSGKPVEIYAKIEGITSEILDLLPDQKHRKAIEPFCSNGYLWIRATATGTGAKAVKQEVYDFEKYSGAELPNEWREYPTGLPQAVAALLPEALPIEAMDDIDEDLGKVKAGTIIKALLDEVMEPIIKAHSDLNSALETVRKILTTNGENRSVHLTAFDSNATKALENFFPDLSIDLDLQVIEAKEFFKAGDLNITDKTTGDRRRFDQMGTGAQRAIQMALIRYLADVRAGSQKSVARRLLLIDEPELYLHPKGVRRLRQALEELSRSGYQVVFSTHSPLMLNRDNASDTVIVGKSAERGTITRKPLRIAVSTALSDAESQSRTIFELGNISEIYFADRVVLCEGKTDRRLLPLAYERYYGRSPELDNVTFVSVGSCSDIPKALSVLKAMEISACAVADLDFAFVEARKGSSPMLPKEGEELKAAKQVLSALAATHAFPLAGNGLPTKDKNGWEAADAWAIFAKEADGIKLAQKAHEDLKSHAIWVWLEGCIEQVTGHEDKGESAILEQEKKLIGMSSEEIGSDMPSFVKCFEWLRAIS